MLDFRFIPGSEARILYLRDRASRRLPLFADDPPHLCVPERIGFQPVTLKNGFHIGNRLLETTPDGVRILEEPSYTKKPRKRYPCDERYRADPVWRASESLRKRQLRLRRWLEIAEIYLHPTGQLYLWEWRQRRRIKITVRPRKEPLHDSLSLWPLAA